MSKIGYRLLELERSRAHASTSTHTHISLSSARRTIKWNLSCHFYSLWHPRSSEIRILCRAHIVPIRILIVDSVHISLRHCKWMRDCDVLSHNRCCLQSLWMRRCELRFNKWRDWRASEKETQRSKRKKRQTKANAHRRRFSSLTSREMDRIHVHPNTLTRSNTSEHTHTQTFIIHFGYGIQIKTRGERNQHHQVQKLKQQTTMRNVLRHINIRHSFDRVSSRSCWTKCNEDSAMREWRKTKKKSARVKNPSCDSIRQRQ